MKSLRPLIWLFLFMCLVVFPSLVTAQSGTSSDPNRETLKELLDELKNTIEDADKRMVAHPRFLEELRALVDRYNRKLREVYIDEDFADGDYTQNPKWVVESGRFRVTPGGRLWCSVRAERPSSVESQKEDEEPIGILLREILKSRDKKKRSKRTARKEEKSVIHTLARIAPAFEIDITFVSDSTWGAVEVVLLGGTPAAPLYRLIYQAAPSRERPIEIVRQRGSRRYTIESALQYPVLDDGTPHRIQWIRDTQGVMRVLVDEKEVLSTVELYYRDDFSGLALVNRGGTYEWGQIRVLQAPVDVPQ